MNSLIELLKWLLEKRIPTSNATSLLVALLSGAVFFFASKDRQWFQDIEDYGPIGVIAALVIVGLIAFLATSLALSRAEKHYQQLADRKQKDEEREQQKLAVRKDLESLTEWQRKFLLRFVVEGRTQIPEFEVGQFRAAWDFEIAVLVEKGIIKDHRRAGVYEIEPVYLDYLKSNWNPATGDLS